jgi:acyl-CoA synthetase (AMP-forming)/AMP-acid ligase II
MGETRVTWQQLADRSDRVAAAFLALGVKRGERVGLILKNSPEYVELLFGLARAGITVAPFSFRFVARELGYAMEHSRAVALVVDHDLLDTALEARELMASVPDERLIVVGGPAPRGWSSYEDLLARDSSTVDIAVSEEETFWLAFTGGTTGFPKAVTVPHRTIVQMWLYMAVEFGIGRPDVQVIAGGFHHGLGLGFGLMQLYVGGTLVLLRDFDPIGVVSAIAAERATVMPGAPAMFQMILNHPGRADHDVSSMRVVVSAGAPLLTATKAALLAYFPNAGLYEHYGATEVGYYSVLQPADQVRKVRSVGLPFFHTEVKILDRDGRPLPAGEVGDIYKRGLVESAGYEGNPEATAEMVRDGWVTSGDMGYLDDEGYLYLVDRRKDMVISGGINIYPTEIEDVIQTHPDVLEVAVIGVPDPTWGEAIKAFVVRRQGSTLNEEAVIAHCRASLASYKKPREVEFVDSLPKSGAGKVLRRQLREAHWAAAGPKV